MITKRNKQTCGRIQLDVRSSASQIDDILKIASFYRNTYAQRYIDCIEIIGAKKELIEIEEELKECLNVPLMFEHIQEREND